MGQRRRLLIWGGAVAAAIVILGAAAAVWWWPRPERAIEIDGAILSADADLHKQRPIAQATIRAVMGAASGQASSDASGFFRIALNPALNPAFRRADQRITITVQHPDYRPFQTETTPGARLELVRLVPNVPDPESTSEPPPVVIANVRVRYAVKSSTSADVGSAARTFEIINKANTPCNGLPPCSPDGKWKATVGAFSLDAGENRQFRNARVSCLAGPCPFTRVESDAFSRGGRVIGVSVLNWADTVTYLVEAEVAQTMVSDLIRHSFPVIFGRSMNFTLPASAQGPSIEAEVNGAAIVFPLGPRLLLSWATCRLETGTDGTRLYRCELKPRYRFK
jgi:hypothetical protein